MKLARDEVEREGVYIHFARIDAQIGQFAEAHRRLDAVTNEMYVDMKRRVARSVHDKEFPDQATPLGPDLPEAVNKPATNAPAPIP